MRLEWKLNSTERERTKEVTKMILGFVEICGQYNELCDNKGRSCVQEAVINTYICLGVRISQEIIYKQLRLNIKVVTMFMDIIHSNCVSITLKFYNSIPDLLEHGKVYNILQSEMILCT